MGNGKWEIGKFREMGEELRTEVLYLSAPNNSACWIRLSDVCLKLFGECTGPDTNWTTLLSKAACRILPRFFACGMLAYCVMRGTRLQPTDTERMVCGRI